MLLTGFQIYFQAWVSIPNSNGSIPTISTKSLLTFYQFVGSCRWPCWIFDPRPLAYLEHCTQRVNNKARKSKYSQNSIRWPPIKQPTFIWQPAAKIPEKKFQLYTAIKTSVQWPPLLSSCGQLLAVPRVILFCFIPLLSGPLSRLPEWLLKKRFECNLQKNSGLYHSYMYMSIKLQLFTKITILAADSYLSYITDIENEHTHNLWLLLKQNLIYSGHALSLH